MPGYCSNEGYDRVLARLDRLEIENRAQKSDIKEQNIENDEQKTENKEQESEYFKRLTLAFEHDKLPRLDGVWVLRKKLVKRTGTSITKPITNVQCASRLPIEERPFEKQVVISSQGQDYFVLRSLYPATQDIYSDLTNTKQVEYQNFGFKGIVNPGEISYAYTLKLADHLENPAFARQLRFKGKLIFEKVSKDKITGTGYEIENTPECHGYIKDEIVFELVKLPPSFVASR